MSEEIEDDDLARMNAMCDMAKELGVVVDVGEGQSPELSADGSLKGASEKPEAEVEKTAPQVSGGWSTEFTAFDK